jgi:hypothetical protein
LPQSYNSRSLAAWDSPSVASGYTAMLRKSKHLVKHFLRIFKIR